MRRQVGWLVGLLISVPPMDAYAQPWSGLLSPSRAVEWTSAGVSGGIPNRATICTTLNPGATATQINNAIAACPSGQVVFLNAGTFNLSSGINMRKNNITLRGAGAAQTILRFSGTTGCFIGEGAAISVCSGEQLDFGSVIHSANWTAGYATGTTVITLSNTTGLVVGNHMMIDQLDDTVDGWPATGDIVVNGTTSFSGEGGNEWVRGGNRGQTQVVTVVAINGLNVTIDPPVGLPNYRASQSPGAWWGNATAKGIGIENLTVDDTGNAGSSNDSIQLHNTLNCWIKGVRVVSNASWGAAQHHNLIRLVYTGRTTIRDGYFYGPLDGNIVRYGWASQVASNTLWENNILHHIPSPIVPNDPEIASVYGYNYQTDGFFALQTTLHGSANLMTLTEGNNGSGFTGDVIHGTHFFQTLFRNHFVGDPTTISSARSAVTAQAHNRFFNVIGNVLGSNLYTSYEANLTQVDTAIFSLGDNRGYSFSDDARVKATMMRWGNYDTVTGTVRFVAAEVPSGIVNFANPVPASQALPPSFYLSARPAWWSTPWGTPPWPAVGPDVTGGNISGYAGHAWKIPARLCYENTPIDSAYGTANVKLFNASACYAQSSGQVPSPPTNPVVQ